MPSKTALMFVDDRVLKIVIGENLKLIRFEEIKAPHNVNYIKMLFDKCHVAIVDKASEISRDDFSVWVEKMTAALPKAEAVVAEAKKAEDGTPTKRPVSKIIAEAEEDSESMLFRSTDETTMTIDDLYTGEEMAVGRDPRTGEGIMVKKTLAIHPYKAVDLAKLPPDAVKNSAILRRMIKDGTLVKCSRKQALEMERSYDDQIRQDNDDRLNAAAPIIDGSVENFVINNGGRLDINAHDATTIDISDDSPLDSRKGEMSLTDLMKMSGIESQDLPADLPNIVDDAPPPPRRPLAARPPVDRTGIKAKGISRA